MTTTYFKTHHRPDCLDDYIDENNVARVIEAFVNRPDFIGLGFAHAELNPCGRPPYDLAMLLKLYLYGYLNRIYAHRAGRKPWHGRIWK